MERKCKGRHRLLVCLALASSLPLQTDLGNQTFLLATSNGASLWYFQQGFRYLWASDGIRAAARFRESSRLDPNCSLCFWGEGLALGPNLDTFDDPQTLQQMPRAAKCASKALFLVQKRPTTLSELARDKGLIQALGQRYSNNLDEYKAQRGDFQRAYAWAMEGVAAEIPTDVDVKALAAQAWLLTMGWDYWGAGVKSDGKTATDHALQLIEAALQQQPQHAGALRLKARVVSGGPFPRNISLGIAPKLELLMPDSPEFQQAAGHAYFRAGEYQKANVAYQRAVDAGNLQVHPLRNLESLVFAYRATGRFADALQASLKLQDLADTYITLGRWDVGCQAERYSMQHALTLLFFGRDSDVLKVAAPPANRTWAAAAWRFARGMASVNLGLAPEARTELAELNGLVVRISESLRLNSLRFGRFQAGIIGKIYVAILQVQVQRMNEPGLPLDIMPLRRAVQLAESLPWDEPPPYYLSPTLFLGAALVARGDVSGAQTAFSNEIAKDAPFRPLALFGLCQVAAAGGVDKDGRTCDDAARQELKYAWDGADSELRAPFVAVTKENSAVDVNFDPDRTQGSSFIDKALKAPVTLGSILAYVLLTLAATCFLCRTQQLHYAPIGSEEWDMELSSGRSSARTMNSSSLSAMSTLSSQSFSKKSIQTISEYSDSEVSEKKPLTMAHQDEEDGAYY